MKKTNKIFTIILGLILLGGVVYASVTTASTNKSLYMPWQGTSSGYYDSAHNVGISNTAESRFSFTSGSGPGGTSIITDSVTGLTWQSEGIIQGDKLWEAAKTYCVDLTLGGYTDWKLPNITELNSIIDYSRFNPTIDIIFFTASSNRYWSSTTNADYTSDAWQVNFDNGNVSYADKLYNYYYVRCIR